MTQIICDLETIADPDAVALVEPPSAPSNYKDPEKIAAYVADAKLKAISDMALRPAGCRVVALGLGDQVTLCPDVDVEAAALRLFWATWAEMAIIVGFNFVGFDLPVLMFDPSSCASPSRRSATPSTASIRCAISCANSIQPMTAGTG